MIGWMYVNGYGVESNNDDALKWLRLASDQGCKDTINLFPIIKNKRRKRSWFLKDITVLEHGDV